MAPQTHDALPLEPWAVLRATALHAHAVTPSQPIVALARTKWMNPELGAALARIKPQPGVPRASVAVPVAPGDALSDTMVFEAADNPQRKFYLPRYSVATHLTDRGSQFRVRMTRQEPGARISIVVQPSMAPEVAAAAADATALDHEVSGELTFDEPGTGLQRVVTFADRRELPDGFELSALLSTLAERDAVYAALTTAACNSRFRVRRTLSVAVPTRVVQATPGGRPRFDTMARKAAVSKDKPVAVSPAAVAAMRTTKSRLQVPSAAPSLRLGSRITGMVAAGRLPAVVVADPTPSAPLAPEPLYRVTTRSLDHLQNPQPFVFSKDLHGYIYGDITGGSANQGGLVLEQLAFDGRHHSYYFAAARPEVVYYLPDAFKLARTPEPPHVPMLSVAFDSSDGDPATTSAIVTFAASAVASSERLRNAAKVLAAKAGIAIEAMDLQPFLADASRLSLHVTLPGAAGVAEALEGARIDLRSALSAGFRMPLDAFQSMFDRLNGAAPRLFDGEVEVRLDRTDRAAEKVPLDVDLADLAGPLVRIDCARMDAADRITITNVIESPIRLDAVDAWLAQDSGAMACTLQPPLAGTALAPGQSVTTDVVERNRDAHAAQPVVTAKASVTPDPAAIWDAVCDDTTSYLTREIVVKAPAQLFTRTPADNPILAILVELGARTGGLTHTVELSAEQPSSPAVVNTPITDLVLQASDSGEYRYRVSTVRADRVIEGEWRQRSAAILWIVDADVA